MFRIGRRSDIFASLWPQGAISGVKISVPASSSEAPSPPATVLSLYNDRVHSGALQPDDRQAATAAHLAQLEDSIVRYVPQLEAFVRERRSWDDRFKLQRAQLTAQYQDRLDRLRAAATAANTAAQQPSTSASSTEDVYSNRPEAPNVYDQSAQARAAGASPSQGFLRSLSASLWPSTSAVDPGVRGPTAVEAKAEDHREAARALARTELASLERQIETRARADAGPLPAKPAPPRGLYVHGAVGSGKSMLVDLFYHHVERSLNAGAGSPRLNARRVHFNKAMLDVNAWMHAFEKERVRHESAKLEALVERERRAQGEGEGSESEGMVAGFVKALLLFEKDKARHQRAAVVAARRRQRELRTRDAVTSSLELARSNAEVFRSVALNLMGLSQAQIDQSHGLAPQPTLLVFDELQVSDPFTALALKGILENLLELGATLVFTSNRPPEDLNRHGLHEELFQHFVTKLLQSTDAVSLSAAQDYRKMLAAAAPQLTAIEHGTVPPAPYARLFLHPLNATTADLFEQMWAGVPGAEQPRALPVAFGRTLQLQRTKGGAARATFEELCARLLGAADYIALASAFDTVFIEGIPHLSFSKRDQARRFITCVDELYNNGVRLIATANAAPDALFKGTETDEPILDLEALQFETAVEGSRLRRDLTVEAGVAPVALTPAERAKAAAVLGGMEEKFAFKRAISRLYEMQSPGYLGARPRTGG